jgi:hypothetical protein
MAQKVKVFENAKQIKKSIEKLSATHQKQAMEFANEVEFQIESFVKNLQAQEEIEKCNK